MMIASGSTMYRSRIHARLHIAAPTTRTAPGGFTLSSATTWPLTRTGRITMPDASVSAPTDPLVAARFVPIETTTWSYTSLLPSVNVTLTRPRRLARDLLGRRHRGDPLDRALDTRVVEHRVRSLNVARQPCSVECSQAGELCVA